jgi:hypothetical protein
MSKTKKELQVTIDYYKVISDNLLKANDELSISYQKILDEKEEWFQHADKAHKENEALVELVKQIVDDTINNLINVEANIGSISVLDVIYNIGIIERVVEAKFNPKTEEED